MKQQMQGVIPTKNKQSKIWNTERNINLQKNIKEVKDVLCLSLKGEVL